MRILLLAVLVFVAACAERAWTVLGPSGPGDRSTVSRERSSLKDAETAAEASRVGVDAEAARSFQAEAEDWTVLEASGPDAIGTPVIEESPTLNEAETAAEASSELEGSETPLEIGGPSD